MMAEFTLPIWLVLSWLIRQIQTVIEPDKDPEGNGTELEGMKELAIEFEVEVERCSLWH